MWTHINEPFLILFRFWVFQLIYHFLLILNKDLENSLTTVLFYAILGGCLYMEVRNLKIDEIKPYENNPRNNLDAVDATANSIKEFGWQQPIVVDKDMVIIAGHTRYLAAKKLGCDTVPVVVASNLSDEQVRAYRLADNKTGELAEWDFKLLDTELQDILDIDMSDFGFELNISEDEEVKEDDFDEEIPEEPKSKLGQIYQLGRHRLMCGDSTNSESVKKLLGGGASRFIIDRPTI